MDLAEQFALPVISLVDTSGAYPGIESEERGVAEAIARGTERCMTLGVPMIATITGEGMSGGAIGIAAANRVLIMEHAIYAVISPEGCASILWKSAERAKDAAEALGLTAPRLLELGLIDKVVREPLGGAHRNPQSMAVRLKAVLLNQLDELEAMPIGDLLERRYQRLRNYGAYQE
jgi:acetyl-CoA carboxylase carboxyl transferase subunit alpha